jgi:hypothetical protein
MLQSRSKLNLAPEPVSVDSSSKIRRQNFYYDLPLQLDFGRDKYARHSRTTQLAVYAVSASKNLLKLALKVGSHGTEYNVSRVS